MKRILIYLVSAVVIASSLVTAVISPISASAASTGSAAAGNFCKGSPNDYTEGGRNGADYNDCVKGYNGAVSGQSESAACPAADNDNNSCDVGYAGGIASKSPSPGIPTDPSPSAAAIKACDNAESGSTPSEQTCEYGYDKAKNNSNTNYCDVFGSGSKTYGSSTDCVTGYDLAKGITPPNGGSPGGGGGGGAGGGGGGGPSTPTCDSGSFSLNWILCPIFNGVADASDWILTSLVEPELMTQPICLDSTGKTCEGGKNTIFDVWSNFRNYGDLILVIALLVMVFGESIGGGLIDAYTVKKVLPRLLAAAILVNMSIYIVAILVDITNVVGGGIGQIITAPLGSNAVFSITPGGIAQGALAAGGLVTTALGAAAIGAILTSAGGVLILVGLVLPALLAILAVFVTIILRKAIIIALIIVSPVAFALYCLPNTERYFKKWWDTLFEMLIIYPIVVLVFAVCDILSAITGNINSNNPINIILSFIFLIVPLFLIPFSFRIAGNTLSTLHRAVDGARQQAHGATKGLRAQARERYNTQRQQTSQDYYSRLNTAAGRAGGNSRFRRATVGRGLKFAARASTGFAYNVEGDAAVARANTIKEINDQTASGDDAEIRGLMVDKNTAATRMNNGQRQFQTISGYWVDETAVDAGKKRWGNNNFAQQAALAYEMRKTVTEDGAQNLAQNYAPLARSLGMSDQQARGTWIGAAFANQDKHLEFKRMDWQNGTLTGSGAAQFVDEMYENRGSYNVSQMNSNTVEQLKRVYAENPYNTDLRQKIASINETFAHDISAGGAGGGPAAVTPDGVPIPQDIGGGAPGVRGRQVSTQGAAHTAERIRELTEMTGILTRPPTGFYTDPDHGINTPPPPPPVPGGQQVPPNQRGQK
jgi:hypothetical protein